MNYENAKQFINKAIHALGTEYTLSEARALLRNVFNKVEVIEKNKMRQEQQVQQERSRIEQLQVVYNPNSLSIIDKMIQEEKENLTKLISKKNVKSVEIPDVLND